MRVGTALMISISCLAAACSLSPFGGDNSGIQQAWHTPTSATADRFWLGRPAVDAGLLFVQDANNVLALDAVTGKIEWSRPVRVALAPAVTFLLARNGRLYVPEVDSVLAIEETTGKTVWNYRPGNEAAAVAPALDESTLYTGERGAPYVDAIAIADGQQRWRVNLGPTWPYWAAVGGVAVSGDTVYATGVRFQAQNGYIADGFVVALDRSTGAELWRTETDSGKYHGYNDAPIVAGRVLVINDLRGKSLVGVDRFTAREIWRDTSYGSGPLQTEVRGGTAYSGFPDGTAMAVDVVTGAVRWRASTTGGAQGAALCGQDFYVNTEVLQRLDAATGARTGTLSVGTNDILTSQVVSDGQRAYMTGETGVFAVECR